MVIATNIGVRELFTQGEYINTSHVRCTQREPFSQYQIECSLCQFLIFYLFGQKKKKNRNVFEFLLMRDDLKRFLFLVGLTRFHNPSPTYLQVEQIIQGLHSSRQKTFSLLVNFSKIYLVLIDKKHCFIQNRRGKGVCITLNGFLDINIHGKTSLISTQRLLMKHCFSLS